ncbi:hypothetical protein MPL3365_320072 [Mesorhizobium plurifarium]|uniref:Uncharacterized protein n=1 Tax=Mesorhizobium plurifarium TaxID=69974 RepID=A0A090GA00_MESPL|nr:hypothetical protein MPL3365_320072 [Mesorhizobium plurifarium]
MALATGAGRGGFPVWAGRLGFKSIKAALPLCETLNEVDWPKLKYWQPEVASNAPKRKRPDKALIGMRKLLLGQDRLKPR